MIRENLQAPPAGPYIVFDLETTGFRTPGDEIVEIAAVRCDGNGKVTDTFEALVKPSCPIGYGAMKTHGITEGMVKDCPSLRAVFPEFLAFIGKDPLVGHNVRSFDLRFLDDACRKTGTPVIGNPVFDTLPLAKRIVGNDTSCGVEALVGYFGLEKRHAHRALPDVLMENDVFLALRERYRRRQREEGAGLFAGAENAQPVPVLKTTALKPVSVKQPGLYVNRTPEGKLSVDIEGYCPMKDVVGAYKFLHWRKNFGKWQIIVDTPCEKNLKVLQREAASLGYLVFSGLDKGR